MREYWSPFDIEGWETMNEEGLTDHQIEEIRKSIIETARGLIGVPYQTGKNQDDYDKSVGKWTDLSNPPATLDCSGLTAGSYQKCGIKIPHGSQAQFNFTVKTDYPQNGDLGFFGQDKDITKIYHVGIYTQIGVIEARAYDFHAQFPTGKVIVRPISKWEGWKNFCGWRVHPKLVQIKAV